LGLILISKASATCWEELSFCLDKNLNLSIAPHLIYQGEAITLSYSSTRSGVLKIYASPYNWEGSYFYCPFWEGEWRYPAFLGEREVTVGDGEIELSPAIDQGLYRIYAFVNNSLCWQAKNCSCSWRGDFFLMEKEVITIEKEIERVVERVVEKVVYPEPTLVLSLVAPDEVWVGEEFSNLVNLTNLGPPAWIAVYSYVYENSTCLSGDWMENRKVYLTTNSSISLTLRNKVNQAGRFKLKLRARVENQTFDLVKPILVKEKVELRIEGYEVEEEEIRLRIDNLGSRGEFLLILVEERVTGKKVFLDRGRMNWDST
jgi:hypothetical protein